MLKFAGYCVTAIAPVFLILFVTGNFAQAFVSVGVLLGLGTIIGIIGLLLGEHKQD